MKVVDEEIFAPDRVVALQDEYEAGFQCPAHYHNHAQLLYASSGVMSVIIERESLVIPPQRALWIPSGIVHEVYCRSPVSLRTLYFGNKIGNIGGDTCRVIEISDLVKTLILEITHIPVVYLENSREGRIMRLLIDEIGTLPTAPFSARMPKDCRLLRVCQEILANPADQRSLDEFASLAGMSRRTFTRAFRNETGMGLAIWRQQVRLMEAVSLLSMGYPITTVAFNVGYDSPSAFTAMFNRSFGTTPSKYHAVAALH